MYPKLSDFFNAVLGTHIDLPIQTYGFFVAMAFLSAGVFLYFELKRKGKEGLIPPRHKERTVGKPASTVELLLAFTVAFIVLFKFMGILLNYSVFNANPQAYLFSSRGNLLFGLIGGAGYAFYVYYQKNKEKLAKPEVRTETIYAHQLAGNILLVAVAAGIAGAKIFDVIEHLDELARDPLGTLFSFSGLTFYGGLIGGTAAVMFYTRFLKIPWPIIGDAVSPGLALAYGVGRMGCQGSGDGCWGVVNDLPKPEWLGFLPDWMWASHYPHNVIDEGILIHGCVQEHCHVLEQAVFPTPFYEVVIAVIFFTIIWSIRKRVKAPGVIFALYLGMNGFARFFVEKIRINIKYDLLGFQVTQAEVIAVSLMILGTGGIIYFTRKYRRKTRKTDHGT